MLGRDKRGSGGGWVGTNSVDEPGDVAFGGNAGV